MNKYKDERMCRLAKGDILKDAPELYKKLVQHASHVCLKCGRTSNKKKRLCKPEKLDD